ncbi:unnamed protein product [Amoebophrya sp. A25]|nr:unnamed protein product [Amoebophrya sp. A25]|eukprot:GSA25T00004040001.1
MIVCKSAASRCGQQFLRHTASVTNGTTTLLPNRANYIFTTRTIAVGAEAPAPSRSTSRRSFASASAPAAAAVDGDIDYTEVDPIRSVAPGRRSVSPDAQEDEIPPWKSYSRSDGQRGGYYNKNGGGGYNSNQRGDNGYYNRGGGGGGYGNNYSRGNYQRGGYGKNGGGGYNPAQRGGSSRGNNFGGRGGSFFGGQPKILGPVTGAETIEFGKHSGRTYEEMVIAESNYVDWLIKNCFEDDNDRQLNTNQLRFVAYALWARQNPEKLDIKPQVYEAPNNFLEGKSVAFTGSSPFPKEAIQELLLTFGATKIANAVSKKTDMLVLLHEEKDGLGKNIKETAKYKSATEKGVRIVTITELFAEAAAASVSSSKKTGKTKMKRVELKPAGPGCSANADKDKEESKATKTSTRNNKKD